MCFRSVLFNENEASDRAEGFYYTKLNLSIGYKIKCMELRGENQTH